MCSSDLVPKVFCTNWFRKGADGKFVWPGYGENMRVLKWMIDRIEGSAQGVDQPFGVSPTYEELNWTGLDFSREQFNTVTSFDKAAWQQEMKLHSELFATLKHHLPQDLEDTRLRLAQKIAA